jgi:hypothetical protein
MPKSVGAFRPDRIHYVGGRVYLADSSRMKAVVITPDGGFLAFHDLAAVAAAGQKKIEERQMGGFSVDEAGNLLFTVPTLFTAYVVSPGGEVKSFGSPGSREGRFNIAGPIARDETGTVYVADVLRCVVLLFDGNDFRYLGEAGGRGYGPGRLIAPSSMAVGNNWLFISQGGDRGVNAYRVY